MAAKKAVEESSIDWSSYFASIVGVCPWSKSYWRKQKIDIQKWRGERNIQPLGDYVARMYIHKHASGRLLCKIHYRLMTTDQMKNGYTVIRAMEVIQLQCQS